MLFVGASGASERYSIPRHIEYSFTMRNTTNQVVQDGALLWLYAPVPLTATQQRVKVQVSYAFQEQRDFYGNSILHIPLPHLTPYDTKIVTISVDLALSGIPQPLPETDLTPYLSPEPYCEVDDPQILALARKLTPGPSLTKRGEPQGGVAAPLETARNIFQWISSNIMYSGYLKEPRGARYALEHKQGDCTEFMYLFVALCRAASIPARGLGGYVVERNAILQPGAYHNWAEFYIDGVWQIADPQKKVFMEHQSKYLTMHIIGSLPDDHPMQGYQRFRYLGEGLDVEMN
jgi:transglutaminase-like putative cysteine protease